ncbi:hypothetical protein Lalb_Chr12g0207801 [Lupinus albus]|uniref:Uncharacterized protein n=1 Tax=Lupinus albus TaxID=3870 RepID=A0A6A4PNT4_LUPAL|nr:hypothetical protein Lalb_Chr12g0207801 [Lupinus albus]
MEVTQWSEQGNPSSTSDGAGRGEGRDPIGFTLWSRLKPPATLWDFDSSSRTRRGNTTINENEENEI